MHQHGHADVHGIVKHLGLYADSFQPIMCCSGSGAEYMVICGVAGCTDAYK